MLALQLQLERDQYLSADWLQDQQLKQAAVLAGHALDTVPFYRHRIPRAFVERPSWETWRAIPVMDRRDIQRAGDSLVTRRPLAGHGDLARIQTSGSTGTPITAYTTAITRFYWHALSLRDVLWHGRDFTGKLLAIRPERDLAPGEVRRLPVWGGWARRMVSSGPAVVMSPRTAIDEQLRVLLAEDPDHLLTLPTNLRALAHAYGRQGGRLTRLKGLSTYGELVPGDLGGLCESTWGLRPVDVYSAQEVGYIALQCPEHGRYHVQSEALIVEIIDAAGAPCGPGRSGRVVITTLQNLGAPLIRYAIGDFAEPGAPCECGRGLPVIQRIQGRSRNMVRLPDGRLHWPSIPVRSFEHIGGIRQIQLAQVAADLIEARLVVERPLGAAGELAFSEVVRERLDYPFQVRISYRDAIPRSRSGKYEDFVCEIPSTPE